MSTEEIYEMIVRHFGAPYLDSKNILWKIINGEWIGKRSVFTTDNRACWLEDADNIKTYWCGVDADYNEIFK